MLHTCSQRYLSPARRVGITSGMSTIDADGLTARRSPRVQVAEEAYQTDGVGHRGVSLEEHLKSPLPLRTMSRQGLIKLFLEALLRIVAQDREIKELRRNLNGR